MRRQSAVRRSRSGSARRPSAEDRCDRRRWSGAFEDARRAVGGDFAEFDGDAGGGASGVGVKHVGRKPAVHLELVGRADVLVEPQRGDAENLIQRSVVLRRRVVLEPPRELAQDRFLAVAADADDEGDAEFGVIGVVEAVEGGELFLAQPVEAGAGLLGGRVGGELALTRRLAGEVRMGLDQREPDVPSSAPRTVSVMA